MRWPIFSGLCSVAEFYGYQAKNWLVSVIRRLKRKTRLPPLHALPCAVSCPKFFFVVTFAQKVSPKTLRIPNLQTSKTQKWQKKRKMAQKKTDDFRKNHKFLKNCSLKEVCKMSFFVPAGRNFENPHLGLKHSHYASPPRNPLVPPKKKPPPPLVRPSPRRAEPPGFHWQFWWARKEKRQTDQGFEDLEMLHHWTVDSWLCLQCNEWSMLIQKNNTSILCFQGRGVTW